jgi:hypothetical protein
MKTTWCKVRFVVLTKASMNIAVFNLHDVNNPDQSSSIWSNNPEHSHLYTNYQILHSVIPFILLPLLYFEAETFPSVHTAVLFLPYDQTTSSHIYSFI